ncbi:PIG-L family deacetylase [Melaminivora sp.]|uniref:PIG-L family deacetylase n=1 Tax=Melaminivora sp. TaxID=1933032 RepID=UPI0028AE27F4|nr:PIG-L family deacetylase [Melaminivora sp.]
MLDRPSRPVDYHFGGIALDPSQAMLCLAPHPDDEVLGSAGLQLLAQRQGLRLHTIIATAGEQGLQADAPAANPRLDESREAARVLGLPEPECWHLPDRHLRHAPPLIDRIARALAEHSPRWLLLPALTEPHPDHQALALAAMAAARAAARPVDLLFYEVGAPTQANTLVDISAVAEAKWRALQCFGSQEERHAYLRHAQALAQLRAFGAGAGVTAAEAYWHLPHARLGEPSQLAAMALWPLARQSVGLAAEAGQLPLVSVIVRSMNRPSLAEAVAAVAQQTYPNIELVIANATGAPHPVPAHPQERLAVRVAQPGPDAYGAIPPLGRSAAANLGLDACRGSLGLFLDDDDLIDPTHVQVLVQALLQEGQAVAAYTGVRVLGPGGQWLRDYDLPWEPRRLQGINHLPIHAVMFRLDVARQASARFDEALPVLEDWDFWCQLSHQGGFAHVPGIHATYRQSLGDSHLSDPQHDNHWARWHLRILEAHALRWGWREQSASLAWHAVALDRAEQERLRTGTELDAAQARLQQGIAERQALQAQWQQASDELHGSRAQLQQAHTELAHLQARHALAERSLELLQHSRPVRWARALRRLLGQGG